LFVRSRGGNNAGPTVIYRGVKYVLHLSFWNPPARQNLCDWKRRFCRSGSRSSPEIDRFAQTGKSRVKETCFLAIALTCALSRLLDEQRELRVPGWTTKRGIGPAYGDKASAHGVRMSDLMQPIVSRRNFKRRFTGDNRILQALAQSPIKFSGGHKSYLAAGEKCALS